MFARDRCPVLRAASLLFSIAASAGVGRAQFGPEQVIVTGSGEISRIHAADLDGDGLVDLVVCRYLGLSLSWHKNLGGGAFGPAQPMAGPATAATDVVTLDVDADGDLDIIASVVDPSAPSTYFTRVNVYANLGGGNFAPPVMILPDGDTVMHLETADIDGDGDLDLIVGRRSPYVQLSTVEVLVLQGGQLSTSPIEIMHLPMVLQSFGMSDIDGDGDVDLVVTAMNPGEIVWLDNAGLSSPFGGPHTIEASVSGSITVQIADLDNDNVPDVVGGGVLGSYQTIRWYKNVGAGLFGPLNLITDAGIPHVALCGDVDTDGNQDVIVRELYAVSWFGNDGHGNFGTRRPITTAPDTVNAMTMADLDGDGLIDVVVGSTPGGGIARLGWFRNEYTAPVPYCFGDGSGTPCPCGNSGAAGNGCASSVAPGGANLSGHGTPSITNDTLVLIGSHMPNSSVLYFQGTAQTLGGDGTLLGDGLRCAGGSIMRLGAKTNIAGTSSYPTGADVHISIKGNDAPGNVREYQCWYRNAASYCTPSTYNLTNGVETTWLP